MSQLLQLKRTVKDAVSAERFDESMRSSDEHTAAAKAECEAARASLSPALQKAIAKADRKMRTRR